ncbi:CGNR zinc finger domain-containing protein [Nonomuraea sp. NPDC046570]|uniref:CGNR zinc finger domain-containing protein n=1 Tax=Nonomuraea sp. NPDC046570 TaxID=3155255 RepID=UPI0033C2A0C1
MSNQDWVWDGGRASLDLVNTYRDRKTGGRELLLEPADLTAWLAASGLTPERAEAGEASLLDARDLREAISLCTDAAMAARPPGAPELALLNRWASARHAPLLQLHPDLSLVRLPPSDPVSAALAEVAHDAVALLGGEARRLVRVCAGPECGLRFMDRSNAGRRQWCSMRRCGNREKVRLHRARHSG